MPYPAALEAGRKGTKHLVPFVNSGTDPNLLRSFFHSSNIGGFNWSRVSDPQVDAWLDEGDAAPGRASARRALPARSSERAMDQAWILPIRDQVNLNAASSAGAGADLRCAGVVPGAVRCLADAVEPETGFLGETRFL